MRDEISKKTSLATVPLNALSLTIMDEITTFLLKFQKRQKNSFFDRYSYSTSQFAFLSYRDIKLIIDL